MGYPTIDLFASRLNHQLKTYCSWKPDPGAIVVDAMCMDWFYHVFYAFPPFNMITRILRKVQEDKAEGIIVYPDWPTPTWFSKLTNMCIKEPCILYNKDATPTLSHPWRKEEKLPPTRMLAAVISATSSKHRNTRNLLASWRAGTQKQYAVYLNKWNKYCKAKNFETVDPKLETILNFLSDPF